MEKNILIYKFNTLNSKGPAWWRVLEQVIESLPAPGVLLSSSPYVLTFMWTAARKKINMSFRDQYTITGSPFLPRIISHLLVRATEFVPRPSF